MKLLLRNIFNVSIRYIYQRGNTYYYQRKVPLDLQPRYGNSKHVKVNLKTNDLKQVVKQVGILNKRYESAWASLRGNPNSSPHSVRESAIRLLSQYGLQPHSPQNDDLSVDAFIDTLHAKEQAYAQGTEGEHGHLSPDDYPNPEEFLSPTELEALRLINEKTPQLRLRDAFECWRRLKTDHLCRLKIDQAL